MWKEVNCNIIVLVSVLSGSFIYFYTPTKFIELTLPLFPIIFVCLKFLKNHSWIELVRIIIEFIKKSGHNFYESFKKTNRFLNLEQGAKFLELVKKIYENYIAKIMARQRRNTYQLSFDTQGFNETRSPCSVKKLTSISGTDINSSLSNSSIYENADESFTTSTSQIHSDYRGRHNLLKDRDRRISSHAILEKSIGSFSNNQSLLKNENSNLLSSPWGTSISPRMGPTSSGIKTVQTASGPLLSSTRYNIDSKTSTDVKSPGLTSRLAKYATEANSKLILQTHHGTAHFPRVDPDREPSPLNNIMPGKNNKAVKVRIAPQKSRYSPPEWQKKLSEIWRLDNNIMNSLGVTHALKDISLKRHASRDDVADLIKKQRTNGSYYSDELENLKELTQKRAREESSKSCEEIYLDKSPVRPVKRTKKPSCQDVINSLSSSSTNNVPSMKRKADLSRSISHPDIEKHFKSLNNSSKESSISSNMTLESLNQSNEISRNQNSNSIEDQTKSMKCDSPKQISGSSPSIKFENRQRCISGNSQNEKIANYDSINVTERLFMKVESPIVNDLKTLMKGRNFTPEFSRSGTDDIKKSDIVNMRQTSMKAKLKSMFDAISGIGSSKIDPNVVIRAEEVTSVASSSNQSPPVTSLNSSTSTTNINTSPIATSAVVPIIKKNKEFSTPKQVTFQLPTETSSSSSDMSTVTTSLIKKDAEPENSKDNLIVKKVDSEKSSVVSFTLPNTSSKTAVSDSSALSFPTFKSTPSVNLNNNSTITSASLNTQKNYETSTVVSISASVEGPGKMFQAVPTMTFGTTTSNFTSSTFPTSRDSTFSTVEKPAVQSFRTESTNLTTHSTIPKFSASETLSKATPIFSFGAPSGNQSATSASSVTFASPSFSSNSTTTSFSMPATNITAQTPSTQVSGFKIDPTITTQSSEKMVTLPKFSKMNPATSISPFGGNNSFTQAKSPFTFGATTSSQSAVSPNINFGTNSLTKFGGQSSATSSNVVGSGVSANSAPIIFGASNITATFGATDTTTPTFGSNKFVPNSMSSTSAKSPFDQQKQGLISSGIPNVSTNSFGATMSNSAGNPCIAASSFANTIPSFSTPQSTPGVLSFGSNTHSIGAPSSTASNLSAPRNKEGFNNTFQFGESQTQPSPIFSIPASGNSSGISTTSSTPSFDFNNAKIQPGFNFGAGSTPQVPASFSFPTPVSTGFNNNSGGMFSIGAGSTAPRSRTARQRRQQR